MKNELIGIAAGVFTSVSVLPQLYKMIREKRSTGVSLTMFIVLIVGLCLWIVYGFMKQDWPILTTNSFSLLVNVLIVYFNFQYKKN